MHLPLLILDEAHHVKNPTSSAGLFDNEEAEQDAEALQGPLGNMFERMLFLTATPFQLGHHELLNVLDRFHGVRWPIDVARSAIRPADSSHLRRALDRAQASALRLEQAWSRIDPLDAPARRSALVVRAARRTSPTQSAPRSPSPPRRGRHRRRRELLRPWVIRHVKADHAERRRYRPGRSILDDSDSDLGLPVAGRRRCRSSSPRARRRWRRSKGPNGARSTRAYFAYGLASSFEAYADTRRNRVAGLDEHDGEHARIDDHPQLQAGTSIRSPPLSRRTSCRLGVPSEGRRHRRPGA